MGEYLPRRRVAADARYPRRSHRTTRPDIVLAHAKDLDHDGEAGSLAAGTGRLDYPLYLSLLQQAGFTGPVILHGLTEAQTTDSIAFLRHTLTTLS